MSSGNQYSQPTTRSMSRAASSRAPSVDSVAMSTRSRANTPRGVRSSSRRAQVHAKPSTSYGSASECLGAPDLRALDALESTATALDTSIQTSLTTESPLHNTDENRLSAIQEEEEPRSIIETIGAGAFGGMGNGQGRIKVEQEETHGMVFIDVDS